MMLSEEHHTPRQILIHERWQSLRNHHIEEYDLRQAAARLTLDDNYEAALPIIKRLTALYHAAYCDVLRLRQLIELEKDANQLDEDRLDGDLNTTEAA